MTEGKTRTRSRKPAFGKTKTEEGSLANLLSLAVDKAGHPRPTAFCRLAGISVNTYREINERHRHRDSLRWDPETVRDPRVYKRTRKLWVGVLCRLCAYADQPTAVMLRWLSSVGLGDLEQYAQDMYAGLDTKNQRLTPIRTDLASSAALEQFYGRVLDQYIRDKRRIRVGWLKWFPFFGDPQVEPRQKESGVGMVRGKPGAPDSTFPTLYARLLTECIAPELTPCDLHSTPVVAELLSSTSMSMAADRTDIAMGIFSTLR